MLVISISIGTKYFFNYFLTIFLTFFAGAGSLPLLVLADYFYGKYIASYADFCFTAAKYIAYGVS